MPGIDIYSDKDYTGEGFSHGLAMGLLVRFDGENLTQEGMGIGGLALKTESATYFSRCSTTESIDSRRWSKTFLVDTRISWRMMGRPAPWIGHWKEKAIGIYMKMPLLQPVFLSTGGFINKLFGITPVLEEVAPLAEGRFEYLVEDNSVEVNCEIESLSGILPKVCLLNELGADSFCSGWRQGKAVRPPSGWLPVKQTPPESFLFDPVRNLRFGITELWVDAGVPARLYWGREKNQNLCWAGFDIEIDLSAQSRRSVSCHYQVGFEY